MVRYVGSADGKLSVEDDGEDTKRFKLDRKACLAFCRMAKDPSNEKLQEEYLALLRELSEYDVDLEKHNEENENGI